MLTIMKTFIRRPGNKSKHLKHIIPLIPEFTGTYYEPFVGTGAIYLHLLPKKAVLNDLNTDITNIWKLVKTDPEYIIQEIDKFKKKFLHLNNADKLEMCKKVVSNMNKYSGKQKIVNYLLMIYCSFNGCITSNSGLRISGLYVHLYKNESCSIFTETYKTKIQELKQILKNVKIENKDYSKILQQTKQGDFVFLDPPYIEDKNYDFTYNKNQIFNLIELKDQLDTLDTKQVKWMMTQIDTPQVRQLFKKYKFKNYINNSNFNNSGTQKKEVIITNY
jgi:DNA adenine methylase